MPESTAIDDIHNDLGILDNKLNSLEALVSGWTRGAFTHPNFEFFMAERAEFVEPPLESAYFRRASALGISTGLWTTIPFDTILYNRGVVGYSTASTGLFIHPHPANLESFFLFGTITFSGGTAGHSAIRLNIQPSGTVIVSQVVGSVGMQNFAYFYRADGSATGFNIQVFRGGSVEVGAPNVTGADFSIIKLARR